MFQVKILRNEDIMQIGLDITPDENALIEPLRYLFFQTSILAKRVMIPLCLPLLVMLVPTRGFHQLVCPSVDHTVAETWLFGNLLQ